MDLYDEVYEIKDGRDIDSPTDLDVSSALQFINNNDDDDDDQLSEDDMEEEVRNIFLSCMHDDIFIIFFHRIYGRIRFPVKFRELTISPVRVSIGQ